MISEPANTCKAISEPANTCKAISEPVNTCEAISVPNIVSNPSVSSVRTGTQEENGCSSEAIDGGSEPPSPASPAVNELQTLPVAEPAHVSEIAARC